MKAFKINCLTDCLTCNCGENCCPHTEQNKKSKRYITLVKNCYQMTSFKNTKTNEYSIADRTLIQQQQNLFKNNQLNSTITRMPLTQRRSPINNNQFSAHRYSQVRTPHYLNLNQQKPKVHRERLSLDSSPKVYFRASSVQLAAKISNKKSNQTSQNQYHIFPLNRRVQSSKKQKTQVSILKPILPIAEQQERQKRSSLFGGARKIISKLGVLNNLEKQKENKTPISIFKSINKIQQNGQFFSNIRVFQTQQQISLTPSILASQNIDEVHQNSKKLHKSPSIDKIVKKPEHVYYQQYTKFKIGKLLGVGKSTQVYICQLKQTNSIYGIKQIFKTLDQKTAATIQKMHQKIQTFINLSHPNIVSIYAKFETHQKICLICEFVTQSLYDYLTQHHTLPLQIIKSFLSDLVQGTVFMHQNGIIHGNINLFQCFINFNQCKIKPSIIHSNVQDNTTLQNFQNDIDSLAILAYQMNYGISPEIQQKQTQYEKQKYCSDEVSKANMLHKIKLKLCEFQTSSAKEQLNDFISMLMNWTEGTRLTAGVCLSHPFFKS